MILAAKEPQEGSKTKKAEINSAFFLSHLSNQINEGDSSQAPETVNKHYLDLQ